MDQKLKDALEASVLSAEEMRERLGITTQGTAEKPSSAWLDPKVWDSAASPDWKIRIGAGGQEQRVTGGTYDTRRYNPETAGFTVKTFDGLTGQLLKTVEEPMEQKHIVKPSDPRPQMAGAQILDYSDSYMVEGHNPGLLLSRYKDVVGTRRKIDTLVGIGISGTIGVVNLARDLGIDYLILRKDGVSAHSSWPAEGRLGKHWLFVDDLISSGTTFAKVWDKMENIKQSTGFKTEFKGAFLYASPRSRFVTNNYDREQFHWWLDGRAEHYHNEFKTRGSKAW
jgi:hypothetical protein